MSTPELNIVRWGRLAYDVALERQTALQTTRLEGQAPDTLALVEHDPVFTLGLRVGAARHLLWDQARLAAEGVSVRETNRGGDITYHGPGQLVAYPIVSLERRRDLHAYLRFLEDVLIATAARHGVTATRRDGLTGIWVGERKLAAIGVGVRRWVTLHGVALNVAPDLKHFTGIVPCGIQPEQGVVTSLAAELGEHAPSWDAVADTLAGEFTTRWIGFIAGQ